ncbi:MAG: molybdenum cofactor biosynthesis protein MoaE, partial [Deltaproteobacteria bacterium]|nr:molybdenum cofactor biosynthesis protein MoaE [Deltaproteobacteria bacterium]
MEITQMMETIKQRPDYPKVGMILCHNGVVRQTSRDGRVVTGLRVSVDNGKLREII